MGIEKTTGFPLELLRVLIFHLLTLLASERSERDTYRGKNEKIGDVCLFIYMDVRMSFCTLTLCIFVFAPRSTRPKLH